MKKYLILLFYMVCAFMAYAEPVSESQALAKARLFMPGKSFSICRTAKKSYTGLELTNGDMPFYVFNAEGNAGFVIVSGDDRTKEILAFSETGVFDENNLPDNVKWWLGYYAQVIFSIEDSSIEYKSSTSSMKDAITPMIQTNWHQRNPYNNQCVFGGMRCVTGCVATAMAQVVNYYRYPNKVAAIDGYTCDYTIPALPATTLNWKNMTNDDIAKLCRYCGQSVEMDYGVFGSGAVTEEVSLSLVKYFGYNKSTHAIYREGYVPEEWENVIYQELAAGHPVLYSGRSTTGYGHAFVCDGYKYGYYHVNWGWGGDYDGYFVLTVMDSKGKDNVNSTYSEDQSAIVGVRPTKGGTLDYPLITISSLKQTAGKVTRGSANENFTVSVSTRFDYSVNSEDDKVGAGIALYNGNKKVKSLMQRVPSSQRPGWYSCGEYELEFGKGLADGTYRIEAVYKDKDNHFHQPQGFGYNYIEAVVKGNKLTLTNYPLMGSVKLNKSKVVIATGKTVTLKASVFPYSLADKSVTWKSSDTKVATVTSIGKVTGVKAGTTTITCTSSTGLSASCKVTVGYVGLNKTKLIVGVGKAVTLKATVYPTSLSDKSVTWTCSNPRVAKVTSGGKVIGVHTGLATIKCTSVATGLSSTCKVTIGSVDLCKSKVTIKKGKKITLKATVYPTSLSNKKVTWKSSNTKVATVTSSGKVKGLKAGTAIITCTSVATGLSSTCKVTVKTSSGTRSLNGDDEDATGIDNIESMDESAAIVEPFDVYDLGGRKVLHQVTSLEGLRKGVYIIHGRKVLVK